MKSNFRLRLKYWYYFNFEMPHAGADDCLLISGPCGGRDPDTNQMTQLMCVCVLPL